MTPARTIIIRLYVYVQFVYKLCVKPKHPAWHTVGSSVITELNDSFERLNPKTADFLIKPAKYILSVAISTTFSRQYSSVLFSYETIFQRKKKGQWDGRNSVAWWITRTLVTALVVILPSAWGPAYCYSQSLPFQCGWSEGASKISKKHEEINREFDFEAWDHYMVALIKHRSYSLGRRKK